MVWGTDFALRVTAHLPLVQHVNMQSKMVTWTQPSLTHLAVKLGMCSHSVASEKPGSSKGGLGSLRRNTALTSYYFWSAVHTYHFHTTNHWNQRCASDQLTKQWKISCPNYRRFWKYADYSNETATGILQPH